MNMIENAIIFATEAHAGQMRRDGTPYIMHPLRVADSVRYYTQDFPVADREKMISAAYLHDVIEDTNFNYDSIEDRFSAEVADLVVELTNDDEQKRKLGKKDYLAKKMPNMSEEALIIKLCDRLDNVSDLATTNDTKWVAKYMDETSYILDKLEEHIDVTEYENVDTIREIIIDIDKYLRW